VTNDSSWDRSPRRPWETPTADGGQPGRADSGDDALGVLLLDTAFDRLPGDVGNPVSYDYPVRFETVSGAEPERVVRAGDTDPALVDPSVDAARRLVDRGAVAAVTSCGFLLPYQATLNDRVGVPVFTSSLLQLPLIASTLATDRRIGVLSADERSFARLSHPVLSAHADRLVVEGLAESRPFQTVFVEERRERPDAAAVGDDVVAAVGRLLDRDVGALLFECTNLRPYLGRVRDVTDLPVYDYLTLADLAWRAVGEHDG
jgi:hypothetical protein